MLRYASYAYDAESGLYYCSARYYDPATRQWTTGDPAKADGEESAYQYCEGDPVGEIDPSGEGSQNTNIYKSYHTLAKWSTRQPGNVVVQHEEIKLLVRLTALFHVEWNRNRITIANFLPSKRRKSD